MKTAKQANLAASDSNRAVELVLVNPALGSATLYVNVEATLQVTLINNGDSIALTEDDSSILFYVPGFVDWSNDDIQDLPAQWKIGDQPGDNDPNQNYFTIRSTSSGNWNNGSTLIFKLKNIISASESDPTTGNFTAYSDDVLEGDLFSVPLILDSKVMTPPAELADVLGITLNNGGIIFVNDPPLLNQLTLNFKNKVANRAIFRGSKWPTTANPKVYISFIWGAGSGALTTLKTLDTNMISVERKDTSSDWEINRNSMDNAPIWTFSPKEDSNIIGTEDQANATFQFSDIAPIINGATQIYAQVTGFPYDNDRLYNNFTFLIAINKSNPPVRGIPYFHPENASLKSNPGHPLIANLFWQAFDIPKVQLTATALDYDWESDAYTEVLVTDNHQVDLSQFYGAKSILFNLYGIDGSGNRLNGIGSQATVEISYPPITVQKFEIINDGDKFNPAIEITIYPIQLIADTNEVKEVTLTVKGKIEKLPNAGNEPNTFVYHGYYKDIFSDDLEVNNYYQFQLNLVPTFGPAPAPYTEEYNLPIEIGDYIFGGVVFYLDPNDNSCGLVCAISDQSINAPWFKGKVTITGATDRAIGSGKANTDKIINSQGSTETNYAAGLTKAYNGGGFTDWFLPSYLELREVHGRKGKINKTAKDKGGDALAEKYYWTSTEDTIDWAWAYNFQAGSFGNVGKIDQHGMSFHVRAIRAF